MAKKCSDTTAGYMDRAAIQSSLEVHGLVKLGGHQISDRDLRDRIINKIPGAQFHRIIMSIEKDLNKETKHEQL